MILTMDSGFAHVAALLNRRHLAIFGSTDPALFAPRARSTRVLYERKLDCQPCNSHDCPIKGIPCMRTVSVDRVIEEIARVSELSLPG
jgi:ADP-heptose:LPS heptosyltransferase